MANASKWGGLRVSKLVANAYALANWTSNRLPIEVGSSGQIVMGGAADANKDNRLTVSELGSYVHSKVKEDAAAKGREQTPKLQDGSSRVLIRW